MALWIDSHRPKSFEQAAELGINAAVQRTLQIISQSKNIPHLLIYGPQGSGKSTNTYCLLQELHGSGIYKMKFELQEFKPNASKVIEMPILSSAYHIDICPSDVGYYDTFIIQELIKSLAKSGNLKNEQENNFKTIVIRNANCLSNNAQDALRRTMEKYIATCRLILMTDDLSGLSSPLKSRCLCIRSPAPDNENLVKLLKAVIAFEDVRGISDSLVKKIVDKSNGNMRRALLILQAIDFQDQIDPDEAAFTMDWEQKVKSLAKRIVFDQKPKLVLEARERLYDLLERSFSPEMILKTLTHEISSQIDNSLKHELFSIAAMFSHRMSNGEKMIIHLEAFVANVMILLKNYKSELNFDDDDSF